MSSQFDLDEMEADFDELLESEETPPEAFYLALKQALAQLEHHSAAVTAA
jgi:hypothetical protein